MIHGFKVLVLMVFAAVVAAVMVGCAVPEDQQGDGGGDGASAAPVVQGLVLLLAIWANTRVFARLGGVR